MNNYAMPKSPTEWLMLLVSSILLLVFCSLMAWQFAAIQGWARGHWILLPRHYWFGASLIAAGLLWWLANSERH